MSKVAVIYEGDKSLLDKDLMSQIDGEPEFYQVGDKDESVAYKKLKQMIQLGLAAALFFIVPAHANADATQKKVAKISQEVGIAPQIIQSGEVVIKQVPQFGLATGTFIMADDFDTRRHNFLSKYIQNPIRLSEFKPLNREDIYAR